MYNNKRVKSNKRYTPKSVLLFLCVSFILLLNGCNDSSDFLFPTEHAKTSSPIPKTTVKPRKKVSQTPNEAGKKDVTSNLILVNKTHPMEEDYQVTLIELSNGECVDESIYPSLQKMFDDARNEGIYPEVISGYRTSQVQQQLLDNKIEEYLNEGYSKEDAKKEAMLWVAVPGTSEHQLGIAVDINAKEGYSDEQEVYDWLYHNSYKYGFIQRYPSDKIDITGISYEPWHYRYVGEKVATEIYQQGISLEEYLGEVD